MSKNNSSGSKRSNNCNDNGKKNNNDDGLGLASLSYAEYVILASTLAYSLSEELNDSDLALLITFFYLVLADLQVLVAQKQIKQNSSSTDEDTEINEEGIDEEIILTRTSRNNKHRRYKGKKRRHI